MKAKNGYVYFSKIKENAIIPSKKREDAGYDFYACFDEDFIALQPFETKIVPTGIAWACTEDYYLQIEERSSTGLKGIKRNSGVFDSGYRGDIRIVIFNARRDTLVFSNLTEEELLKKYPEFKKVDYLFYPTSKAIAQGVIHRVYDLKVEQLPYEDLCKITSERGAGSFGSSKK